MVSRKKLNLDVTFFRFSSVALIRDFYVYNCHSTVKNTCEVLSFTSSSTI